MVTRIQDACSNICEGAREFASAAGEWISKTVTTTSAYIGDIAHKVAEFARPYFENLKTFAQENKQSLLIAGVAFAVGSLLSAIIANVFCRGTNTTSPAGTTTTT